MQSKRLAVTASNGGTHEMLIAFIGVSVAGAAASLFFSRVSWPGLLTGLLIAALGAGLGWWLTSRQWACWNRRETHLTDESSATALGLC